MTHCMRHKGQWTNELNVLELSGTTYTRMSVVVLIDTTFVWFGLVLVSAFFPLCSTWW
jgi:hypothetical protein